MNPSTRSRAPSLLGGILAVSLVTIPSLLSNAATNPRIVPLRTNAAFSSESAKKHWTARIKTTDGRAAYVLSLEPDYSVGNHLAVLNLVLQRSGDKPDAPNLLDPTGIWHGIQPCDFVANDLAQGAQKSVFGVNRTILVKNLGLAVRITVAKAMVSPTSAGNYQLEALNLQIEVDNSSP
jgi:hypothetical protein